MNSVSIQEAACIIRQGGVIAYPTESCYGLGCDPRNIVGLNRILKIKRRPRSKGLIIIADHISRLRPFILGIPPETRDEIIASWPGPNTWLLPARKNVSSWLRGSHDSIAVRVTRHRQAKMLCRIAGMAIVSTSANRSGRPSYRDPLTLFLEMGEQLDGIMEGRIGTRKAPSVIRNGEDGRIVRA